MESILWFLITGILFFFMMRYGCGAHIGGHGGHGGHGGADEGPPASPSTTRDPVCGMEINKDQAYAMVQRHGRQIYFCSESCQNNFNANPDKYL